MARAAEDKARAELEVSMAAAAAEEAERVKRQEEEEAANREAEKLLEAEDDSMGTIRKGKVRHRLHSLDVGCYVWHARPTSRCNRRPYFRCLCVPCVHLRWAVCLFVLFRASWG